MDRSSKEWVDVSGISFLQESEDAFIVIDEFSIHRLKNNYTNQRVDIISCIDSCKYSHCKSEKELNDHYQQKGSALFDYQKVSINEFTKKRDQSIKDCHSPELFDYSKLV